MFTYIFSDSRHTYIRTYIRTYVHTNDLIAPALLLRPVFVDVDRPAQGRQKKHELRRDGYPFLYRRVPVAAVARGEVEQVQAVGGINAL